MAGCSVCLCGLVSLLPKSLDSPPVEVDDVDAVGVEEEEEDGAEGGEGDEEEEDEGDDKRLTSVLSDRDTTGVGRPVGF